MRETPAGLRGGETPQAQSAEEAPRNAKRMERKSTDKFNTANNLRSSFLLIEKFSQESIKPVFCFQFGKMTGISHNNKFRMRD